MSDPVPDIRVAFLGLGVMGSGMAHRLVGAGFRLAVFNRSRARTLPLAEAGARVAESPADAAHDADIIISMVADDAASREVWLGEHGAMANAPKGTVMIECSSLSPPWIVELASEATRHTNDLLDAPVTGSKVAAAEGQLRFLVGGSAEALAKAQPVFSAMGRGVVHVGPTGSGALLKLINNYLSAVQAASLAEALTLIERSGLNPDTAVEVLTNGAPGSPLVKTLLPRMQSHDYTPNFALALMAKDLRYAISAAAQHNVELTTATAALALFQEAAAQGHGSEDFSAVIELIRGS